MQSSQPQLAFALFLALIPALLSVPAQARERRKPEPAPAPAPPTPAAIQAASGGGVSLEPEDGWKADPEAQDMLDLRLAGSRASLMVRVIPRAGDAGPVAWLRAYVKHVREAEGEAAVVRPVDAARVAGRAGADAVLTRAGLRQKVAVLGSKNAEQCIVVVCTAPAAEWAKQAKVFDKMLETLKEL